MYNPMRLESRLQENEEELMGQPQVDFIKIWSLSKVANIVKNIIPIGWMEGKWYLSGKNLFTLAREIQH